ncbi:MAG: recombinase RecT [bacterium]|nr:recombinase RecT [bacterium]
MNQVAKIEKPLPTLNAGAAVRAIVPQTMDEAYRLAKAVCLAGMAPRGLDKPESAMIAILHGLEIGLTPMSALQRIAVVNGRPTIWGDAAIGLVRGSGLCKYVKEEVSGEGDQMVATCTALRKGENEPIIRTFSADDAKAAGLWGKSGPWKQYTKRMLQMRARAFALRDGFADVLGGLYLKEELDDAGDMKDVTPIPPPAPTPPTAPRLVASAADAVTSQEPQEAAQDDTAEIVEDTSPHDPETGEVQDAPKLLPIEDSATLAKALSRGLGMVDQNVEALEKWRDENADSFAILQPIDRDEVLREIDARMADAYEGDGDGQAERDI